jgi:hypothetical protein
MVQVVGFIEDKASFYGTQSAQIDWTHLYTCVWTCLGRFLKFWKLCLMKPL